MQTGQLYLGGGSEQTMELGWSSISMSADRALTPKAAHYARSLRDTRGG